MFLLAGYLALLAVVFLLLAGEARIKEVQQKNRMMEAYMDSMQEYYAAISEQMEEIRRYRHDLARHIDTVKELMRREDTPQLQEYCASLTGAWQTLQKESWCSDEVVNAVLLMKRKQCEKRGVPFQAQVRGSSFSGLRETDLVGLLHNLLDNAIEANERIPKGGARGVSFLLEADKGKLHLHIENQIPAGRKISFVTQKENKEEHGVGTRIIRSVIHRYHGRRELHVLQEENRLTDDIWLDVPETEKGGIQP